MKLRRSCRFVNHKLLEIGRKRIEGRVENSWEKLPALFLNQHSSSLHNDGGK